MAQVRCVTSVGDLRMAKLTRFEEATPPSFSITVPLLVLFRLRPVLSLVCSPVFFVPTDRRQELANQMRH